MGSWRRMGLRDQDCNKTKCAALAMCTALDVDAGSALPERACRLGGWRFTRGSRRLECCARLSKQDSLVAVGEQAVVADAVEGSGQHMQRVAAQEFDGLEVHDSSARAARVVLVAKAHRVGLEGEEPLVGDRRAVGIAAEVVQYLLGSGEGALGVDDPGLGAQGTEEAALRSRPGERRAAARERQAPRANASPSASRNLPRNTTESAFTGKRNPRRERTQAPASESAPAATRQ